MKPRPEVLPIPTEPIEQLTLRRYQVVNKLFGGALTGMRLYSSDIPNLLSVIASLQQYTTLDERSFKIAMIYVNRYMNGDDVPTMAGGSDRKATAIRKSMNNFRREVASTLTNPEILAYVSERLQAALNDRFITAPARTRRRQIAAAALNRSDSEAAPKAIHLDIATPPLTLAAVIERLAGSSAYSPAEAEALSVELLRYNESDNLPLETTRLKAISSAKSKIHGFAKRFTVPEDSRVIFTLWLGETDKGRPPIARKNLLEAFRKVYPLIDATEADLDTALASSLYKCHGGKESY